MQEVVSEVIYLLNMTSSRLFLKLSHSLSVEALLRADSLPFLRVSFSSHKHRKHHWSKWHGSAGRSGSTRMDKKEQGKEQINLYIILILGTVEKQCLERPWSKLWGKIVCDHCCFIFSYSLITTTTTIFLHEIILTDFSLSFLSSLLLLLLTLCVLAPGT